MEKNEKTRQVIFKGFFSIAFQGESVMPSQGPCGELAKRLLEFHMETVSGFGSEGWKNGRLGFSPLWIGLRIAVHFFGRLKGKRHL